MHFKKGFDARFIFPHLIIIKESIKTRDKIRNLMFTFPCRKKCGNVAQDFESVVCACESDNVWVRARNSVEADASRYNSNDQKFITDETLEDKNS